MALSLYVPVPYELFYFPIRGKAQAIRYLLLDNKLDFTDTNVGPRENWIANVKPKMPFGQVPYLKDGDFGIAQTTAILRYLGRQCGAHPTDAKDAARADMINEHAEDIRTAYVKMIYGNYEEGKGDHIKAASEKSQYIENLFKQWGNEYILGKVCFADYNLFDLLDIHEVLSPGFLDQFPLLKAYYERMAARPAIKTLRDTAAFKALHVNGNGKQ